MNLGLLGPGGPPEKSEGKRSIQMHLYPLPYIFNQFLAVANILQKYFHLHPNHEHPAGQAIGFAPSASCSAP